MTYYIVIPGNRETAVRAAFKDEGIRAFDNPDEDEIIGTMVEEAGPTDSPAGQGRKITGTTRATAANVANLRIGNAPWLEIVEEWPADWVRQNDGV